MATVPERLAQEQTTYTVPLAQEGQKGLANQDANELDRRPQWWRTAVTLQIYPRSFQDSDGDGNGDIRGITSRMNEIASLGVDAIWINPFHESPGVDGNYDLSSYVKFNKMFGDKQAVREMVEAAHARGIRVIFDIVMNHTSNEHPWYKYSQRPEMKACREASGYDYRKDPLANMYIFRPVDPEHPDTPPNNWKSFFADVSAWTKDPVTGEWVFAKFTPGAQPDLNLYNPLVRAHMVKTAKRWIQEYGIDGIRMDVIDHTFEDPLLRDFPVNPNPKGSGHLAKLNWHERWLLEDEPYRFAAEVAKGMREVNPQAVSIGEVAYDEERDSGNFDHLDGFYTKGQLDIPFNFAEQATVVTYGANAERFKAIWDNYIDHLPEGACPNVVLSNHDQTKRLADIVGAQNMKPLMMMLLTLGNHNGSNAFLYMGDELGMVRGNVITSQNDTDPQGKNLGVEHSRAGSRTAIPWGGRRAFSASRKPWLPVGQTADGTTYAQQDKNPNSMLNFTRGIISAKKGSLSALRFGEYVKYSQPDTSVFTFGRKDEDQDLMINLNFSDKEKVITLPEGFQARVVRSTDSHRFPQILQGQVTLQPNEGIIVELIH